LAPPKVTESRQQFPKEEVERKLAARCESRRVFKHNDAARLKEGVHVKHLKTREVTPGKWGGNAKVRWKERNQNKGSTHMYRGRKNLILKKLSKDKDCEKYGNVNNRTRNYHRGGICGGAADPKAARKEKALLQARTVRKGTRGYLGH